MSVALYLPVLYGTVREGRRSYPVARYVVDRLGRRPDVRSRLVDARDLPFGNVVRREWEMDPPPPDVAAFVPDMARADGFVVVTPEYNYGMPGALKNLLDHLYDEWNRKPFGIVSTGGQSGGIRAADQLRQVIAGLGAVSVPRGLAVPNVGQAFGPDGPREDPEGWARRFDAFFDELEWYARALRAARESPPADSAAASTVAPVARG
jgi:NAD(P)H-dependent FMN reductase